MSPVRDRYAASVMNTFGPPRRVLVRGEGCYVWDDEGNRYLDMLGGIAVNALGHAHPTLAHAVHRQMSTLGHISNFFASEPQVTLAERLLNLLDAGDGRVFFTNSGAEANEAAFKIARRTGRARIVAAHGGFHGRTMGALALTARTAYREPFEPLPGGVMFVDYGDTSALAAAVDGDTAAVVLEPIQGEAGVVSPPAGYLEQARRITEAAGALLWIDEVQTGIGRTGTWFAHQPSGVRPDLVTLAKGLGGGYPVGACIGIGGAGSLLEPGQHGTTFGGNPPAAAAALAVLDTIERDGLLDNVRHVGDHLIGELRRLCHPAVREVRGRGLLIAVQLTRAVARDVAFGALEAGLIINDCTPDVLRLAPPLVLRREQADEAVEVLGSLLDDVNGSRLGEGVMTRHFLRDDDLTPAEQECILDLADEFRADRFSRRPLAGPKAVAILFDKPSTRTRISFSVGVAELGGYPLVMDAQATQLGRGEPIEDTARVLGRQVSAIVWRTFGQDRVEALAGAAGVPVVNALTDQFHPCQVIADLQTIRRHTGRLPGRTLAYLGDGANNMAHSYLLGGTLAGMHVRIGAPAEYQPDPAVMARAEQIAAETGGSAVFVDDPAAAVEGADAVATDTWVSMGQEGDAAGRSEPFVPYAVTAQALSQAAAGAVVLHCLPAYRGKEIAAEVIDGDQSVVWEQAENRLHAQKALLTWLLQASERPS